MSNRFSFLAFFLYYFNYMLYLWGATMKHGMSCKLTVFENRNYAAVAADTFSSELGILSNSQPRLITSLTLRKVPRGTNGGVTLTGIAAGSLGAFTIALTSLLLPFCSLGSADGRSRVGLEGGKAWGINEKALWVFAITSWGTLGSILDSLLGGLLQASVVDKRTGKVVEGTGGQKVCFTPKHFTALTSPAPTFLTYFFYYYCRKVLVHPGITSSSGVDDTSVRKVSDIRVTEDVANALTSRPSASSKESSRAEVPQQERERESRKIETGHDVLDNNAVNVLMAAIMSIGAIVVASYAWNVPVQSILL